MGTTKPSKLSAALAQIPRGGGHRPCMIANMQLDAGDRKALEAALTNPQIEHNQIQRALQLIGVSVASSTIARHRRRICGCYAVGAA